jgi:excinuclease UvrABC nuclease subunit
MSEIKGQDFTWSKPWIEHTAPNSPGVYSLRDKQGNVLYIGKGKVRERLLSHWNRENSSDAAIWDHAPAAFRFELTAHPDKREADLVRELKPPCNPVAHSRFRKFW